MEVIYLDNNATTPMLPEVWEAMRPYFAERPGNPASSHAAGRQARQALEDAREQIAALLGAQPDEVVFTSGATEANNLALSGLSGDPPGAFAISAVEHPSVTEPAQALSRAGFRLVHLSVDSAGQIALPPDWPPPDLRLCSVQLANHETGVIQDVAAIAESGAPVHCDAAAAVGKVPISFKDLGAAALTVSAHKFHGPKGIGALLVRKNARLRPLFRGGHQQQGKRPGTEPVALAVGMAAALAWSAANMERNRATVLALRSAFLHSLREQAAPVVLNGPEEGGIPHTLNLSFPGCRADVLLMKLDLAGIACSTGSACSSGSLLPSPVLSAMGLSPENLNSAMRFSLSPLLEQTAIEVACARVSKAVKQLRNNSGGTR